MDILSHAVGGYTVGAMMGFPLEINLVLAVIGAAPDLVGYLEKIVKNDKESWDWYEAAHYKHKWLWLIVPYGMHCLLDSFTHEEGKRWWVKGERLWAEILYWIILIVANLSLLI